MALLARIPNRSFKDMVKADARVLNMYAIEKQGHYTLPTGKLTQDLLNLQAKRRYRNISSREILSDAQGKIIDWTTEAQAVFSRANTIRMHAFAKKRLLDEHIKQCRNYLSHTYHNFLKNEIATVKGREFAVHDALEHFNSLSYKLETLILLADMLISELDKSGYSVNHSLEAVKLNSRPERNI